MSLLPKDAQLSLLGGANLSLGVGKPLVASNAVPLIEQPEPESTAWDELEGLTDEERAQALLNRAQAILVNTQQRQGQQAAVELANDAEYWFAVYFQTREQKNAFLAALKYVGDTKGDKYIDGADLAAHMGFELPARPAPYKVGKIDRKMRDMT